MQCTMLIKKPTRRSTRLLTLSLQKSTALLTSLKERMLMLLVTNQWKMMQERCQWVMTQSRRPRVRALPKASQRCLIGTQTTCLINYQWKAHPSQSPLIWLRRLKSGKAPGPSGIVVEMIRAAGDMGVSMIHDLAAAIIHDGKVPSDW